MCSSFLKHLLKWLHVAKSQIASHPAFEGEPQNLPIRFSFTLINRNKNANVPRIWEQNSSLCLYYDMINGFFRNAADYLCGQEAIDGEDDAISQPGLFVVGPYVGDEECQDRGKNSNRDNE